MCVIVIFEVTWVSSCNRKRGFTGVLKSCTSCCILFLTSLVSFFIHPCFLLFYFIFIDFVFVLVLFSKNILLSFPIGLFSVLLLISKFPFMLGALSLKTLREILKTIWFYIIVRHFMHSFKIRQGGRPGFRVTGSAGSVFFF